MNELEIIAERINTLPGIAKKERIFLEDVPEEFRLDLQNFIMGRTLTLIDGKPAIGRNLYKWWLNKLETKGFDYEIDYKKIFPPTSNL